MGRAGHLVGIAVPMYRYEPVLGGDQIALTVYACSAIDTCGTVALASATIPTDSLAATFPPATPQFKGSGYFDLSTNPVTVTVGRILRFRLDPPGGKTFGVPDSGNDAYPAGRTFSQPTVPGTVAPIDATLDLAFGTFVTD